MARRILSTPIYKPSRGVVARRNSQETEQQLQQFLQQQKTYDELSIRIAQLEINEREACNVLTGLCEDAAISLGIARTEYRVDDILSGLLLVQNMYKRIQYEKLGAQEQVSQMSKRCDEMLREKDATIEKLQEMVDGLQLDLDKSSQLCTELTVTQNSKSIRFLQEINDLKEVIEQLRNEHMSLDQKLKKQSKKLLEVPRIEEQAMRQARSIVRQVEVENTIKEMEFKKISEDVKSLLFWKNKTKALEEMGKKQKADIDYLTKENRLSLGRYQNLLVSFHTLKRLNPHANVTIKNHQVRKLVAVDAETAMEQYALYSGGAVGGNNESDHAMQPRPQGKKRPTSAPASLRTKANVPSSSSSSPEWDAAVDAAVAQSSQSSNHSQELKKQQTAAYKNTLTTIEKHGAEVAELKSIIATKDRKISSLFQKLSFLRAYPLQSMDDGKYKYEEDDGFESHQDNKKSGMLSRRSTVGDLYDLEEEMDTQSFLEEERQCQQKRVDEALYIQNRYHAQAQKTRANNPPHIAAIRRSKSFGKLQKHHTEASLA